LFVNKHNPERVAQMVFEEGVGQPFQGCVFIITSKPRVALALLGQPWAIIGNPVGVRAAIGEPVGVRTIIWNLVGVRAVIWNSVGVRTIIWNLVGVRAVIWNPVGGRLGL